MGRGASVPSWLSHVPFYESAVPGSCGPFRRNHGITLEVVSICGADLSDLPDTPEELLSDLILEKKAIKRRAKSRAKSEGIGDNSEEE